MRAAPAFSRNRWTRLSLACAVSALSGCAAAFNRPATYSNGVDDGYVLGAADAVKRLYWAKQALESPDSRGAGRTEYYVWEESGTTADGRKLAPDRVAVPVFLPAPVGSQAPDNK